MLTKLHSVGLLPLYVFANKVTFIRKLSVNLISYQNMIQTDAAAICKSRPNLEENQSRRKRLQIANNDSNAHY